MGAAWTVEVTRLPTPPPTSQELRVGGSSIPLLMFAKVIAMSQVVHWLGMCLLQPGQARGRGGDAVFSASLADQAQGLWRHPCQSGANQTLEDPPMCDLNTIVLSISKRLFSRLKRSSLNTFCSRRPCCKQTCYREGQPQVPLCGKRDHMVICARAAQNLSMWSSSLARPHAYVSFSRV